MEAHSAPRRRFSDRALDLVERAGNRLPDPALLFVVCLVCVWVLSALLAPVQFAELDPRTHAPIRVQNQLAPAAIVDLLVNMTSVFTSFPPLGAVLVALLGMGVAEHAGLIDAALRRVLAITPARLLTPVLILVGILSHTAADAGFVLVIPLGGVLFAAAGRHPLVGIAAAFAGVSGGFSANLIPSALDPMLQGITQQAIAILDPTREVNPLCNWYFTAASSLLIILLGWWVTERLIEPRLASVPVDGALAAMPAPPAAQAREGRALAIAVAVFAVLSAAIMWAAWPTTSPLRGPGGGLTETGAPMMKAIIPMIFLLSLGPGIAFGFASGRFTSHRDVIQGMARAMSAMGYYLAMSFCAAQFIAVFTKSNLGALLAIKGATTLQELHLPLEASLLGAIAITSTVNLAIGSASAQWTLLAPILVPMLAQIGLAPELTQAAFRIGDSATNVITPLMTYFPLVVVYCQRHTKSSGIGSLTSIMMPYSLTFLVGWSALLLLWWHLGIPLGVQSHYVYP